MDTRVINTLNETEIRKVLYFIQHTKGIRLTLSYENLDIEESTIAFVLQQLSISINLKGFDYLKCAIELGIANSEILENITKNLYPTIADIHQTDSSSVEHAIRHAIKKAWSCNQKQMQHKIFGNSCGNRRQPTNSEFIATVVDFLLMCNKGEKYFSISL